MKVTTNCKSRKGIPQQASRRMARGESSIPNDEFYLCQKVSGNTLELCFRKRWYSTGYRKKEISVRLIIAINNSHKNSTICIQFLMQAGLGR